MDKTDIEVFQVEHHRNGVCGAPFDVILFDIMDGSVKRRMVGIVFETPNHVAMFDLDLLTDGDIKMGSNSWRGDNYEAALRKAIIKENDSPF